MEPEPVVEEVALVEDEELEEEDEVEDCWEDNELEELELVTKLDDVATDELLVMVFEDEVVVVDDDLVAA